MCCSIGLGSIFTVSEQDSEIKEQIDRDVLRTRAEMHFFSGTDNAASLNREVRSFQNHQPVIVCSACC